MKVKVVWLSLSATAVSMFVALWASAALADEGPQQQEDLEFNAWVHSLQASGGKVEIGATFENRTENPARVNLLLNVELGNGDDRLVFQEFAEDELLEPGEPYTLDASWVPDRPGAYSVKLGVFSTDWSVVHEWVDNAADITRIDDGAGTEGWFLEVGRQESRVQQSSKSRVSQSGVIRSQIEEDGESIHARVEICDGGKDITGSGPLVDEQVRERVEDAREQARERTEEALRLRDEILKALRR